MSERFSPGNIIGKLREVDFSRLEEIRKNAKICILCRKLGIGYIAHSVIKDIRLDSIQQEAKGEK